MSEVKLNIPDPPPGTDPPAYLRSLTDPRVAEAFAEFSKAAVRIAAADPDTVELLRIRNAAVNSCEY